MGDILEVMPWQNTIERVEVSGATLLQVLEHSVTNWNPEDLWGGFLQYSGMDNQDSREVPLVSPSCADICAEFLQRLLSLRPNPHKTRDATRMQIRTFFL